MASFDLRFSPRLSATKPNQGLNYVNWHVEYLALTY